MVFLKNVLILILVFPVMSVQESVLTTNLFPCKYVVLLRYILERNCPNLMFFDEKQDMHMQMLPGGLNR